MTASSSAARSAAGVADHAGNASCAARRGLVRLLDRRLGRLADDLFGGRVHDRRRCRSSPATSSPPISSFHSWSASRPSRRPPAIAARFRGPRLQSDASSDLCRRTGDRHARRAHQGRHRRRRHRCARRASPTSASATDGSSPSARSTRPPRDVIDATGLRRRPRLRRPAHALRRPAALGPDREPVERARRHHRDRRQLRLHARAAARPATPTTCAG